MKQEGTVCLSTHRREGICIHARLTGNRTKRERKKELERERESKKRKTEVQSRHVKGKKEKHMNNRQNPPLRNDQSSTCRLPTKHHQPASQPGRQTSKRTHGLPRERGGAGRSGAEPHTHPLPISHAYRQVTTAPPHEEVTVQCPQKKSPGPHQPAIG
ncbi:uncharacterized protein K452DRAFT_104461 [Aplosporella prunicola CBS 121167]|uniref:Uncharacterized protein n=1 Tax=Aplosporella prunicola CBS 121167 TaxID=1176127 RepID=A0A6A6BPK0_9PEZI|nr:uncharacterized protein K452DRAFT_104461 [Aplosporella prunicola CBS 121167]KAF2145996.1 hypothetical protein K452DRAFT_104461 [Aplosporella prunicola CBS 121167]